MKKAVGIFIMVICVIGLSLTPLYADLIEVTHMPLYSPANTYTTVTQTVVLIKQTSGTPVTLLKAKNFKFLGGWAKPVAMMTPTIKEVGGGAYTLTYTPVSPYAWPPASGVRSFIVQISAAADNGAYAEVITSQ